MKISTKGRYALRALIDLAENESETPVPMRTIAKRQGISLKYLERIVPVLVEGGYLEGTQGRGGGYRLIRSPKDCRVGDILRLTEGDLAPVACLSCDAEACGHEGECRTIGMWRDLNEMVTGYLDGVTIADLAHEAGSAPQTGPCS